MDFTMLLAYFVLGNITGIVGVVSLTLYLGRRALERHKKETNGLPKMESVNSRMKKVMAITAEQLELQDQVVGPQKNALHGKYKNGLNGRIKELNEQKTDILKSIIADGFDPEISIIDGAGVVTKVKLSEYLAQTGVIIPPKNSQPTAKQVDKFTVIRGGKDDSENTTH